MVVCSLSVGSFINSALTTSTLLLFAATCNAVHPLCRNTQCISNTLLVSSDAPIRNFLVYLISWCLIQIMADSITSLMFKLYSISSYVYTSCHILIFPPLTTSLTFYFNSLIKCCQMMKRALIKWYAKYLLTKADYRCKNNAHKMISDVLLINQCITIISYAMYICSYFSLWQLHSYIAMTYTLQKLYQILKCN